MKHLGWWSKNWWSWKWWSKKWGCKNYDAKIDKAKNYDSKTYIHNLTDHYMDKKENGRVVFRRLVYILSKKRFMIVENWNSEHCIIQRSQNILFFIFTQTPSNSKAENCSSKYRRSINSWSKNGWYRNWILFR